MMVVSLAGASLHCRDVESSQQPMGARPTADARIAAWLDCDECGEGQLAAVVELGDAVVPSLAATLRDGLSPAYRKRLELRLREHYASRRARGETVSGEAPSLGVDAYVAQQVGSWEALHRSRAATALGRIGTEAARRALRETLEIPQRPSVEMAVRAALEGDAP
jgi:HEAT repeat protein